MKILPLKGYKSLRALNGFHALLLGLKMLPAYIAIPYETFYASFKDKSDAEKEKLIREAILFVPITQEEIEAIITFAADPNGIPYGPSNVKSLDVQELHETITAVCMQISRFKIDILSADEKKNSLNSLSTSGQPT